MVKMSKMAGNSTQVGTFAPLWEVFRISSDKLALCHAELVKKLQDLIKEIGRYGDEQIRVHKKPEGKDEVAGTLEAVQVLQGAAQHLPKAKENYHSRCQELERLRREGASQKEIDKAESKSRKAVEALRRAVEKYNLARDDFEQKMLDSAMRFQEVEDSHLCHMKALISSFVHSVEDTHVQIGQVHEEFKQNMENIGVETLLRNFAESKGTGRHPPGPLNFEELSMTPAQEGPKRTRSKAFRIPGLGRKDRERDSVESPDADSVQPPEVDEEGFTVRPETNQNAREHGNHFCSSSDSDYDDEEPHKFYIRIKPVQPRERTNSAAASAAVEQLKASVGNLILPPSVGCTMKRHSSRHLKSLASAAVETDSDTAPAPGNKLGKSQTPRLANRTNSCDDKVPEPDALPVSALFGPPLESAFENEDFSAPRAYLLASSPSPFSSSSPENVEDSGLDSPSHPATGPSPDSRLWSPRPCTPQSPLGKRSSKSSLSLRGSRRGLLAEDGPNPWLPQPASQDLPCFASDPDWADSVSSWPVVAHSNSTCQREASSPDPFSLEGAVGNRRPWPIRPRSPASGPCTPQSPLGKRSSKSSLSLRGSRRGLLAEDGPNPWLPQPTSQDLPCFASDPDWADSVSSWPVVAHSNSTCQREASSPDPFSLEGAVGNRRPWPIRPRSPASDCPPRACERDSCLSSNSASSSSSSPAPPSSGDSTSPSPWAPRCRDSESGTPGIPEVSSEPRISRGPSPVVLGSQDALPVATAFTEYIHAYFKGQNPDSCLVKVTGELTMSFPAGIVRVFSGSSAPPVLSFRLLHTAPIEQFLPNADLLFSDPSQSDPSSKDFWLNMGALTAHLQKQAEQVTAAPYFNVPLLRYQYSKQGLAWAPLQLTVNWECASDTTRVCVDYNYNASALASAVALTNVQVLLPIEEPVANVRLQPTACWNLEEKRLLWRLLDVPGAEGLGGCGRLLASWEPLNGPSKPSPVAAQFTSEGSTVSGADVELVGSGYRMSLVKKRFATGIYLAGS
ncbi:PREDICTED: F-BAR domain only protein 1 [Gekko japonicus]|uniref:F-BAR domain only protein 1 n=1 Tax=Gekko japonicus TaxID=146911 RepID=A0ABM1KYR1_GEKJA|nr:PREDICTED: F-BAR domain only protein 1 [Gekko japonicus]